MRSGYDAERDEHFTDFRPARIERGMVVKILRHAGRYRSWRTLWRWRERWEVAFIGKVKGGSIHHTLNQPSRVSVQAEDMLADLEGRFF